MPLTKTAIQCIDAPEWADVPDTSVDADFDAEAFKAIQAARDQLLAAVHDAVTEYLSDPDLCFDDDSFPTTQTLNGEYYLGRESYIRHADVDTFHVAVMARCLGASPGPRTPDDYLGLEVHLQWLPDARLFVSWRNTDSSVI